MDAIQNIMSRISVRQYSDREISDEALRTILEAGMSGPSCVNARDWSFIVVRDPETLNKMADANGRPAQPLRSAKVGILVCGDLERAFQGAPDYWVVDGSIAAQNMILAANALGIGSVWLGTWPQEKQGKGPVRAVRPARNPDPPFHHCLRLSQGGKHQREAALGSGSGSLRKVVNSLRKLCKPSAYCPISMEAKGLTRTVCAEVPPSVEYQKKCGVINA